MLWSLKTSQVVDLMNVTRTGMSAFADITPRDPSQQRTFKRVRVSKTGLGFLCKEIESSSTEKKEI
jgi:hypothetical protein